MYLADKISYNEKLRKLHSDPTMLAKAVSIIKGNHKVSKRILEHLTRNFAIKYHLILKDDFVVIDEYRKNLPKSNVDPCRRGPRIILSYKGERIPTTLQQLESLIWVLSTPIMEFAENNYERIKQDLNQTKGIANKRKRYPSTLRPEGADFVLDIFTTEIEI